MSSYIDVHYPMLLRRIPRRKTTTTCLAAWSKVPNKKKQQQRRLLGGNLSRAQSATPDALPSMSTGYNSPWAHTLFVISHECSFRGSSLCCIGLSCCASFLWQLCVCSVVAGWGAVMLGTTNYVCTVRSLVVFEWIRARRRLALRAILPWRVFVSMRLLCAIAFVE